VHANVLTRELGNYVSRVPREYTVQTDIDK
jgi:hypothetical protein